MKFELGEEVEPRIYSQFDGLEAEYQKLADTYKTDIDGYRDRYKPEYLAEIKEKCISGAKQVHLDYIEKARNEVEALKNEYREKYDPKPEAPSLQTTEDKLLFETKRNNNITVYKAQLESSSIAELKDLYIKNHYDEDFMALYNVELKKREKDPSQNSRISMLRRETEADPVSDLFKSYENKLNALASVVNAGHGLKGLSVTGIKGCQQFNIANDFN